MPETMTLNRRHFASPAPLARSRSGGTHAYARWPLAFLMAGWAWLSLPTVRSFTLLDHNIPATGTACTATFSYGFDDILASPGDHWTWDFDTIYYQFDASFDAMFPELAIKDQVRLALTQWATASATACGTRDDYFRNATSSAPNGFIDIRTVTVHEMGHVLGLSHPDAGAAVGRNYRGATCVGPFTVQSDTGREVMASTLGSGWCNHILSWDELAGYAFAYPGRTLAFIEAGPSDPVHLVFTTYSNPSTLNIARGRGMGTLRNAGQPTEGAVVTAASICFNQNCSEPIGFRQHGFNWDITASVDTHRVSIRTRGTDNRNLSPAAVWKNNGAGVYEFGTVTHSAFGADQKDDITHRWSNPPSDIPAGTLFHVGLVLDVWDWTVVNAVAFDAADNPAVVPTTVGHEWQNGIVSSAARELEGELDDDTFLPSTNLVRAQGFRIVASEAPVHRVSDLRLGVVSGLGLTLANLNRAELARLEREDRVTAIPDFGAHTLGANEDFVVVLQGTEDDLPPELRAKGNYFMLNRPELVAEEVFAYWQSASDEGTVGNFVLLGERPVVSARRTPTVSIAPAGNTVVINFTGVLEYADNITGGWLRASVPSPYFVEPVHAARFYRAVDLGGSGCDVDFQLYVVGLHPNPWQLGNCHFSQKVPAPANTEIAIQNAIQGLKCGQSLVVTLTNPASSVEVSLLALAQPPTLRAFDAGMALLNSVTPGTTGQPQTLLLSGPGITTVVIDAPQDEVWMLQFKCR